MAYIIDAFLALALVAVTPYTYVGDGSLNAMVAIAMSLVALWLSVLMIVSSRNVPDRRI